MDITYLINTVTPWNEPPRARHQLATALAKDNRVVFVARNQLGWPKVRTSELKTNLALVVPYFPVDYRLRWRLPIINEGYQNWLYTRLVNQYGDKETRVINFDNTATRLFKYFKNVIYYCNDEFTLKINAKSNLVSSYWKFAGEPP